MDKSLPLQGYRSWFSFINNTMLHLSIDENDLDNLDISQTVSDKFSSDLSNELNTLKSKINDNKLHTYSNLYDQFSLQNYLSFGLPKSITKDLSKIRISAHDLLIERGRYFRPRMAREERLCTYCNQVEDEEHFILFCNKYKDLRSSLFRKIGIIPDLSSSGEAFHVFKMLMNPTNAKNTKHMCNFISEALKIR